MESVPYIFDTNSVKKLLANKLVVFIGDSVVRSMYKDVVLLLEEDRMLTKCELKTKGEMSFLSDTLIEGGQKGEMTNGKSYTEVRELCRPHNLLRFYFVTRVYSTYMETIIADLVTGPRPDVVVINSCLWDITRYGPRSMAQYEINLQKLFLQLKRLLAPETLVIWTTSMPVAEYVRGGFLMEEISFMSAILRLDILSANYYASQVVSDNGFDVLDLHYAFRRQTSNRAADGIHWNSVVHRAMTNMLLWHICEAWHVEMPAPNRPLSYRPLLEDPPQTRMGGFESARGRSNRGGIRLGPAGRAGTPDDLRNDRADFGVIDYNLDCHFGAELTNTYRPNCRPFARRGKTGHHSYRHCPY